MRILLASRYFLYPSCNGASQLTRRMSAALRDLGHQVVVICVGEKTGAGHVEHQLQDGIEVHVICQPEKDGDGRPLAPLRPNAVRKGLLQQLLTEIRPDILHVTAGRGLLPLVESAHEMRVPIVATLLDFGLLCPTQFLLDDHGVQCNGAPSVRKCWNCVQEAASGSRKLLNGVARFHVGRWLEVITLGSQKACEFDLQPLLSEGINYLAHIRSLISCFLSPAPIARRIMEKHGVPRNLIADLVYSLPDQKLVPRPHPSGQPLTDRPLRVGYAGRVSAEKGIRVLIDAFRRVCRSSSCELRILGRGADLKTLATLCPEAKDLPHLVQTGRIRLCNNLDEDAMRMEMAEIDTAIIPSVCYECTPLTLLEFLAQGVPCIVSDSDGLKHLVSDGVNGRVFPVGDVTALSQVIQSIANQPDVLERWRKHLYRPTSDTGYARTLIEIYSKLAKVPIQGDCSTVK